MVLVVTAFARCTEIGKARVTTAVANQGPVSHLESCLAREAFEMMSNIEPVSQGSRVRVLVSASLLGSIRDDE